MANSMSCIIDFEQSTMHNRFIVKTGFIPELDESKVIIYLNKLEVFIVSTNNNYRKIEN